MLVWPADPAKGEQRAFCSADCILEANGWDWEDPTTLEQHENAVLLRALDDSAPEPTKLVKKGRWPLTRYREAYAYATDVAHVTCASCRRPMRKLLTPWQRKLKKQAREAKAAERRKAR